jgi:hypothetical protein
MSDPSKFETIERLVNEGRLGCLGIDILFNVSAMKCACKGRTDEEALELLMKGMTVEFARYDPRADEMLAKATGTRRQRPPRNFTLYTVFCCNEIIFRGPTHFRFEGSWEGLDHELRKDAEILEGLGFRIDYRGYNPNKDYVMGAKD